MTDRIEQIIAKALLQPCDNHRERAELARETARQVMEVAPRQDDFLWRMAMFFDRDATAGAFCAEDGDGGFVAAAERMAREIDRLRAISAAPETWQYRVRVKGGEWGHWLDGRAVSFRGNAYETEERPLYLHPSPSYADGLKEGLRRAAQKATSFLVGDPANGVPLRNPMAHEIADAVLSLLPKEEGE